MHTHSDITIWFGRYFTLIFVILVSVQILSTLKPMPKTFSIKTIQIYHFSNIYISRRFYSKTTTFSTVFRDYFATKVPYKIRVQFGRKKKSKYERKCKKRIRKCGHSCMLCCASYTLMFSSVIVFYFNIAFYFYKKVYMYVFFFGIGESAQITGKLFVFFHGFTSIL